MGKGAIALGGMVEYRAKVNHCEATTAAPLCRGTSGLRDTTDHTIGLGW